MTSFADFQNRLKKLGVVKIEGLLHLTEVGRARDLIYQCATDHALYADGRWTSSATRFSLPKAFRKDLKSLTVSNMFPKLIDVDAIAYVETLVGEPVTLLPPGQQILFTLPETQHWSVPYDVWHLDTPRLGSLGPPGLQMFICLDDVPPSGGGTLVIAGSHRLLNHVGELRSKDVKRRLTDHDYFKWLFSADRDPITALDQAKGRVGDVDLEIVELCGQAGDVYLMDLRALHTPAPNASNAARIMMTGRLPRKAVASKLMGAS